MCSYNECLSDGQQDAQEAYHALVHSISSEESKRRKNAVLQQFGCVRTTFKDLPKEKKRKIQEFANLSRNETFIDQLFGGSTINQITCLSCSSVTKTKDHFVDLSVPMPKKEERGFYRKKQRSGESGMSKHQKKKQQKENRKKDKGNKKNKGEGEGEPQQSVDPVLQNGHSTEEKVEEEVEEIQVVEEGALLVEEIELDVAEEEVGLESIMVGGMTEEDTAADPNTSSKLEEIIVTMEENPKLKGGGEKLRGGVSLVSVEEDEEEDAGLCSLFEQEEEEEAPPAPKNGEVEGLTQLFEDLDIDTTDYGDDTLDACLAQFCKEELLTGDNQFSCVNCGKQAADRDSSSLNVSYAKSTDSSFSDEEDSASSDTEQKEEDKVKPVKVDAKCRYFLNTLPPILVIHLKRFALDNRGNLQKDRRHINYPIELELDKFVLNGGRNRYKLFGVVDHSGSLHRGHYIAYVRKRDPKLDENLRNKSAPLSAQIKLLGQINAEQAASQVDKWYCCNDERISEVNVKKALSADAYLLFYERCSPYL